MSAPYFATHNGYLDRAAFPAENYMGETTIKLEAIENAAGDVVAVYFSGEGAVELHHIPNVIHALRYALDRFGEATCEKETDEP